MKEGFLIKWFKHFSDAIEDPFVQGLLDEFGPLGYLIWFGTMEVIAKENGSNLTGKLTISPTYLRRKFRTSQVKVREVLTFCQTFRKVSVTFSEKEWELNIPKLLELKDNYTKDLQGTSKKPSLEVDVEVDVEKEEDTPLPPKVESATIEKRFADFWKVYPKKKGKGYALKAWKRLKPTQELCDTILKAVQAQKSWSSWQEGQGRYIPHPATWLNQGRWEDEADTTAEKPTEQPQQPKKYGKGVFV